MAVLTILATKMLLDRAKAPAVDPIVEPETVLGNWYANAVFWKPLNHTGFLRDSVVWEPASAAGLVSS